jgi:transcriptional regulator with XRE-family HTH domain
MEPKPAEKRQARRLRREQGMPMKRIAAKVGVSLSTVSLWVRDIELDPAHRERNRKQEYAARATTWSDLNRTKRRAYQEEGRSRARQDDPLHQGGCMLYWAEGSKERNGVIFANSDANMIRFFRRFLVESIGLAPERLAVRLNVYTGNGLSIRQIEDYWLRVLALPRSCLRKHTLNHFPTSSSGRKKNKLPYGVCTLSVHDTHIAQHILGAIQEYAGFDEPRWLDGPARKPAANGAAANVNGAEARSAEQ